MKGGQSDPPPPPPPPPQKKLPSKGPALLGLNHHFHFEYGKMSFSYVFIVSMYLNLRFILKIQKKGAVQLFLLINQRM